MYEDPRIDDVEKMLPGANCGGWRLCRLPYFRLYCGRCGRYVRIVLPGGRCGDHEAYRRFLGKAAPEREPMVAVLRCNGSQANRPRNSVYDGASSCAVEAALYAGETGCAFGCLGKGDCVTVCNFDALHMDPERDCRSWTGRNVRPAGMRGRSARRCFLNCVRRGRMTDGFM